MANKQQTDPIHPPLVTIGITCFNAESTIRRATISAQKQSWPNLEILILDDGSSDDSVRIVNSEAERDSRIRLIQHDTNKGTAVARTSLVNNAKGEFLVFFDDDDESMPERIAKQVEKIQAYEEKHNTVLIACYTSRTIIKPGTGSIYVNSIGATEPCPYGEMIAKYLLCGELVDGYNFSNMGSCTLMARLSVYRKVGDFDAQFRRCAEWDWAIRLAFLRGHFISCSLSLIKQHETITDDKSGRKPLYYALLLRKKYKTYLERNNLYLYSNLSAYAKFYYARENRIRFRLVILSLFLLRPRNIWKQWVTAKLKKNHKNL